MILTDCYSFFFITTYLTATLKMLLLHHKETPNFINYNLQTSSYKLITVNHNHLILSSYDIVKPHSHSTIIANH